MSSYVGMTLLQMSLRLEIRPVQGIFIATLLSFWGPGVWVRRRKAVMLSSIHAFGPSSFMLKFLMEYKS